MIFYRITDGRFKPLDQLPVPWATTWDEAARKAKETRGRLDWPHVLIDQINVPTDKAGFFAVIDNPEALHNLPVLETRTLTRRGGLVEFKE